MTSKKENDVARDARSVSSPEAAGRSAWPELEASDLALAVSIIEREMPGWWWSGGVCSVSAHASCGPDAAGPDADLLMIKLFDEGFHADCPQPVQLADALRLAFTQAWQAREKEREKETDQANPPPPRKSPLGGQACGSGPSATATERAESSGEALAACSESEDTQPKATPTQDDVDALVERRGHE